MGRFKPARTPADIADRDAARAAKLEALHTTLTEHVATLRGGQDWQDWLNVAARFHHYSLNNVLLIAAQRPQATAVAGFGAWQALGRQVDKGEKGIAILAPNVHRAKAGVGDSDPAESGQAAATDDTTPDPQAAAASASRARVAGFRVVHVFDLAQTSGEPLPERPTPHLLAGQAPAGLWAALAVQVAERGFTLHRGDCGPGVNGLTHYGDRTVTVRADVDDAQAVRTLAHELAHVLQHDPTAPSATVEGMPPQAGDPTLTAPAGPTSLAQCRGRVEVEAESVAYLVSHSHGLDTGAYTFPYVAGWAASVDALTPEAVVRATAGRVLAAARIVLSGTEHLGADPTTAGQVLALHTEFAAGLNTGAGQGVARTGALLVTAGRTERAASTRLERPASTGQPAAGRPGGAPAGTLAVASPSPERLMAVHSLAVEFYTGRLHAGGPDARRAAALLSERGVDRGSALAAALGYAPRAWTNLVEHLRTAGVDDGELLASGLVLTSSRGTLVDRFRDRLIFPVQTSPGRTVALLGRAVDATAADRSGNLVPKYLNSPDTAIYCKGGVLYGLSEATAALAAGAKPVIVEGPMDVLAVNRANTTGSRSTSTAGFCGVAACGTALTPAQVALLDQATGGLAGRGVITAFDPDAAGRQAGLRAFGLLRDAGAWPHALDLPAGLDPALLLQQHGPAALHAALLASAGRPLADLVVDERIDRYSEQLHWVEGQLGASRSAANVIATLPADQVGRQVVRVASRLELPVPFVSEVVVDAVTSPSHAVLDRASSTWQQPHLPAPTAVGAKPARPAPPPVQAARTCAPGPAVGAGRAAVVPTAAQRARAGFPVKLQASLRPPPTPGAADSASGPEPPLLGAQAVHRPRSA